MQPDDHMRRAHEAAQQAHTAAKWSHRLSTLQLWLFIGPALLFLLVICGGCGYVLWS